MGASEKMPYPKWVWSPAGGWYCHPKQWERNTKIGFVAIAVITFFTWTYSASKERRLSPPDRPIPSQMWCKYANVDDPGCVFGKKA